MRQKSACVGVYPSCDRAVFVNTATQGGFANPYFAEVDITLTQALKLGDKVTATQEVLGFTSSQSSPPMVVVPYPATLNKPAVLQPLYGCGRVVPVDKLNPGTVVDVHRNGDPTAIGEANVTTPRTPVVTASLNQPDQVTAIQTACPNGPGTKKVSPPSDPKGVFPDQPDGPTKSAGLSVGGRHDRSRWAVYRLAGQGAR